VVIFWFGGFGSSILFYFYLSLFTELILIILLFPLIFGLIYTVFVSETIIFSKLFLILINLIHKPKEGIFLTEKGNKDYEFWRLRIELKKIVVWLTNNFPLPWIDTLAFRWFGVKIDFTSHLQDAWCDVEFIDFGRKVMIGQGAVVMSSMIVGKYLIIKKVIFDDYVVVGGQATIAPGTIIGKNTVIGALSTTKFFQYLEESWIYFGIPAIKLKPNKFAESRKDIIKKVDVDEVRKYKVKHELNSENHK
jgi:carbonic anhydrase/acetyltransferase-like protein (isoleucine patch superfamily)